MATQNRNLYDQREMDEIRREFGINVNDAMAAAVEETKDVVIQAASAVSSTVEKIDHNMLYFILGVAFGMATMIIARFV